MQLREFQRFIEPKTGMEKSQIETRVRRLREAGFLPVGGRGRNAPDIDATHAAMILIAIAGAEYSTDATRMIDLLGGAEDCFHDEWDTLHRRKNAFLGSRTVLALLVHLITNPSDADEINNVQIYPRSGSARVFLKDGKQRWYLRIEGTTGDLRPVVPKALELASQPCWDILAVFIRQIAEKI